MQLTQKIAVAAGALTLAATGIAAASDAPPEAADQGLTTASEQVGVELPANDDHAVAEDTDATDDAADAADEADDAADDAAEADEGIGPVDNHGAEVSAVAQTEFATGREHGEAVSEVARQDHGPEAASTAGESDDEGDAGTEAPSETSAP